MTISVVVRNNSENMDDKIDVEAHVTGQPVHVIKRLDAGTEQLFMVAPNQELVVKRVPPEE